MSSRKTASLVKKYTPLFPTINVILTKGAVLRRKEAKSKEDEGGIRKKKKEKLKDEG